MRADRIGSWVVRQDDRGRTLTLSHLCESIVNDGPFTRCGRKLKVREGTSFVYVAVPPIRVCEVCS